MNTSSISIIVLVSLEYNKTIWFESTIKQKNDDLSKRNIKTSNWELSFSAHTSRKALEIASEYNAFFSPDPFEDRTESLENWISTLYDKCQHIEHFSNAKNCSREDFSKLINMCVSAVFYNKSPLQTIYIDLPAGMTTPDESKNEKLVNIIHLFNLYPYIDKEVPA